MTAVTFPLRLPRLAFAICGWRWQNDLHEIKYSVCVCNRSQMTSKRAKNKKAAHEAQPSVSLMFLPHFDVLCDLLLNRRTATLNLSVLHNKELKYTGKKSCHDDVIYTSVLQ